MKVLKLRHCLNGISEPLQVIASMEGRLYELDISYNLRNKQLAEGTPSLIAHGLPVRDGYLQKQHHPDMRDRSA